VVRGQVEMVRESAVHVGVVLLQSRQRRRRGVVAVVAAVVAVRAVAAVMGG